MSNHGTFNLEEEAYHQAEELSIQLRRVHERFVDIFAKQAILDSHLGAFLAAPLGRVQNEIPLEDVRRDLVDFGLMAARADRTGEPIPGLKISPDELPVPLLPDLGTGLPRMFSEATRGLTIARPNAGYPRDRIVPLPLEVARTAFFGGLRSFLGTRIAGTRWFRSHGGQQPPGGGGAGPASITTASQKWEVHTRIPGLSVYYAGTHAARNPPNYLGGLTSPVDVFLPMGTLFLGGDSLPGGNVDFDPKVVTVPSSLPTFHTKRF